MKQKGLFDEDFRLEKLSRLGDSLEKLNEHVDWEIFRTKLESVFPKKEAEVGGRPPFDYVLMFKILILQRLNNIADDKTGFPLNAIITGANVHDSQLAIPMEQITAKRVQSCYSLMDAAYDTQLIDDFIRSSGRVPIIDPNKRKNANRPPLDPAKKERFKFRSGVERANGYLKDRLLPAKIFCKGHSKVSLVLMSAVICLAALRTLQYFSL